MQAVNHSLAGAIVAVIVPAPLVPIAAIASHYLLDMTPHFGNHPTIHPWTYKFKVWLVADAILCVVALLYAMALQPNHWFIIGVGAFFGAAPDLLWIWNGKGPRWFKKFSHWASVIQWGERPDGWILELFYTLMMVITLYLLA